MFSRRAATAAEIAAIDEERYHKSATHVIGRISHISIRWCVGRFGILRLPAYHEFRQMQTPDICRTLAIAAMSGAGYTLIREVQ